MRRDCSTELVPTVILFFVRKVPIVSDHLREDSGPGCFLATEFHCFKNFGTGGPSRGTPWCDPRPEQAGDAVPCAVVLRSVFLAEVRGKLANMLPDRLRQGNSAAGQFPPGNRIVLPAEACHRLTLNIRLRALVGADAFHPWHGTHSVSRGCHQGSELGGGDQFQFSWGKLR